MPDMPRDPYPYASAEDRARHRRSIAARWERAQKDAEAITALFKRNDAERSPALVAENRRRAEERDRIYRETYGLPDMTPAVNAPHVDLVRRVAA